MSKKLVSVRAYRRYRLGVWENVVKHKRSYPKR